MDDRESPTNDLHLNLQDVLHTDIHEERIKSCLASSPDENENQCKSRKHNTLKNSHNTMGRVEQDSINNNEDSRDYTPCFQEDERDRPCKSLKSDMPQKLGSEKKNPRKTKSPSRKGKWFSKYTCIDSIGLLNFLELFCICAFEYTWQKCFKFSFRNFCLKSYRGLMKATTISTISLNLTSQTRFTAHPLASQAHSHISLQAATQMQCSLRILLFFQSDPTLTRANRCLKSNYYHGKGMQNPPSLTRESNCFAMTPHTQFVLINRTTMSMILTVLNHWSQAHGIKAQVPLWINGGLKNRTER